MESSSVIREILEENERRNNEIYAPFNPITGKGSVGERNEVVIDGFPLHTQYLPVEMTKIPLVKRLVKYDSLDAFLQAMGSEKEDYEYDRQKVIQQFVRLRCRYDFPFWAAMFVYIKNKGGGEDVLFRLTRPQRRFIERLEKLRKAGYIDIIKSFVGKRPNTSCRLTSEGMQAFEEYVETIKEYLKVRK